MLEMAWFFTLCNPHAPHLCSCSRQPSRGAAQPFCCTTPAAFKPEQQPVVLFPDIPRLRVLGCLSPLLPSFLTDAENFSST